MDDRRNPDKELECLDNNGVVVYKKTKKRKDNEYYVPFKVGENVSSQRRPFATLFTSRLKYMAHQNPLTIKDNFCVELALVRRNNVKKVDWPSYTCGGKQRRV